MSEEAPSTSSFGFKKRNVNRSAGMRRKKISSSSSDSGECKIGANINEKCISKEQLIHSQLKIATKSHIVKPAPYFVPKIDENVRTQTTRAPKQRNEERKRASQLEMSQVAIQTLQAMPTEYSSLINRNAKPYQTDHKTRAQPL